MNSEIMEKRIQRAFEDEDEQWLPKDRIFALVKSENRCLFNRTLAAVAFEDGEGNWTLND